MPSLIHAQRKIMSQPRSLIKRGFNTAATNPSFKGIILDNPYTQEVIHEVPFFNKEQ